MENVYDLIIIGAGTAGLTAAQYGGRANLKTLVIEEQNEGGQAVLINLLENYPGLPEPVSGYDFSANLKKQALEFGAEIISAKVLGIGKKPAILRFRSNGRVLKMRFCNAVRWCSRRARITGNWKFPAKRNSAARAFRTVRPATVLFSATSILLWWAAAMRPATKQVFSRI